MSIRVGLGFDAHPLTEGRPLILGGVEVSSERGLSGHSDGDVVVHAIMDALLGAASLGDKGTHFPPTDPSLEGVSSLVLLARVGVMLFDNGWRLANLDATILAQRPRLGAYMVQMKQKIAATLGVASEKISLKATTTDHLGFTGREEGIAAHAVALIEARE